MPSWCHLLYGHKQLQSIKDEALKAYCDDSNREICRRRQLLQAFGCSDVLVTDPQICCDHCSPKGVPYKELDILKKGKRKRQQKAPVLREISEECSKKLKAKLLEERDNIVSESVGFQMLGHDVVCHPKTIAVLCSKAPRISTLEDIDTVSGLRPQLRKRIFNVMMNVLSDAPPPSKRHRK